MIVYSYVIGLFELNDYSFTIEIYYLYLIKHVVKDSGKLVLALHFLLGHVSSSPFLKENVIVYPLLSQDVQGGTTQ